MPIILGMVLGGIMETKLRTSMMRVKSPLDFIDRPIAFILFLIILVVIAAHFRSLWRARKTNPVPASSADSDKNNDHD